MKFLNQYEDSQEEQFGENYKEFHIVIIALFEIVNCEKV